MMRKLFLLTVIVFFFLSQPMVMAEGGNLWRLADKDGHIGVFVREPANESGQSSMVREGFKKALEQALLNRKSTKFELSASPENSDIQIYSIIKKFTYMEKGPFKPTPGVGTTLLDAASTMTDNYAEMTVDFTVIKTGSGEILWRDTLNPYIKKKMEPEDSIPLISAKIASNFIWKCFGKPS